MKNTELILYENDECKLYKKNRKVMFSYYGEYVLKPLKKGTKIDIMLNGERECGLYNLPFNFNELIKHYSLKDKQWTEEPSVFCSKLRRVISVNKALNEMGLAH